MSISGEYSKSDPAPLQTEEQSPVRISEVISALSYALDMTKGQPFGHLLRSCVSAMHIAREIGLSRQEKSDLYYAVLLKDADCTAMLPACFKFSAQMIFRPNAT